jgi:ribonuclease P protein component
LAVAPVLRLKRRADFLLAAAKGRKAPMPGLVLQARERGDTAPVRVGFTCTKKLGNAVARNRAKRRLREAARLALPGDALAGVDVVLIGRDKTAARPFPLLIDDVRHALARALPGRTP